MAKTSPVATNLVDELLMSLCLSAAVRSECNHTLLWVASVTKDLETKTYAVVSHHATEEAPESERGLPAEQRPAGWFSSRELRPTGCTSASLAWKKKNLMCAYYL